MTNRELLLDNYEDASFALLMEDFAQHRGEKFLAENERMKADPDASIPELITRRSLNFIHNEFSKNKRNSIAGKLGKKFLRFLAVAALVALLFSAAYALSPQFRAGTLNLLMQFDEKAATFRFTQDNASDGLPELEAPAAMPTIQIGWLPEGYEKKTPVQDRISTTVNCTNVDNNIISISVFVDDNTSLTLDLENAEHSEELTIQGHVALLVIKDDLIRLTWGDKDAGLFIYLYSDAVDADTLIRIAEDVTVSR